MILIPKTKKAKERLKQAGTDQWFVVEIRDRVKFSSESGPWLHMSPSGKIDKHSRWVHKFNDEHFTVKDD